MMMSDKPSSDRDDRRARDSIDITLPLDTRYIATLRLLTASLAADAGFSVDEIDDLRLAISEVWSMMAESAPDGRVTARFSPNDAGLAVTLTLAESHTDVSVVGALTLDELGRNILEMVADSYSISGHDVTITKRASEVTAN